MTSPCASCNEHRREVTYNVKVQGMIIYHTCKLTGKKIYPESAPFLKCPFKKVEVVE